MKVESGTESETQEFNHQLLQLTASFSAKEKIACAEKYISMWLPPNCKMSILLAVQNDAHLADNEKLPNHMSRRLFSFAEHVCLNLPLYKQRERSVCDFKTKQTSSKVNWGGGGMGGVSSVKRRICCFDLFRLSSVS